MDSVTPDVQTNGHMTDDNLIQRITMGYEEAKRRDTLVEREKFHWKVMALLGWGMALLSLGVACWLFFTRTAIQAFVQVVQVDDTGKVVPLGLPKDLLDYAPAEGQYLDMLGEWIVAVRWRGIDSTLAQDRWAWAYRHTCGEARQRLQYEEETEKPFVLGKRRVTVQLQSITKTPSPLSYHALWNEVITEATQQPRVERWGATFTVGRLKPKDQAHVLQNRLGLCVAAFDHSRRAEEK